MLFQVSIQRPEVKQSKTQTVNIQTNGEMKLHINPQNEWKNIRTDNLTHLLKIIVTATPECRVSNTEVRV